VSATDPDCGVNAKVTYSIAANLGFENPAEFTIGEIDGRICIVAPLDYETRKIYEFPVTAKDQDGLDTTAMVKVTLIDVNDNYPEFYPRVYTVNLKENSPLHSEVVVVRATDADSGSFGQVTYEIIRGNEAGHFGINRSTGVISLKKTLSNQDQVINLDVRATDGGGEVSLINGNVSISVIGRNQQPPTFESALYRFSVPEDASRETSVGTIVASTSDPENPSISYSIISGDPNGFFSMGQTTGVISVNSGLDHDTTKFALLNVQAMSGDPPSYGNAQVNISITDTNDNAPEFTVNYIEIQVREDVSTSAAIYTIQATDKDSGVNAKVRYQLKTNPESVFKIDQLTGKIGLNRGLDYETRKQYTMVVNAYDLGTPVSQNSDMTVIVNIQDVNDHAPIFNQSSYFIPLGESIPINTKFFRLNASDEDSGNNGRITYSIQEGEGSEQFGIFSDDGYLYNRQDLDREVQDMYLFTVVATDAGQPQKSSTALVTVSMLDANDNNPEFLEDEYVFHMEENIEPDSIVGAVSAIDRDIGTDLRYSLTSQNDFFRVYSASGIIRTRQMLNREEQEVYEFSVGVSDGGSAPRSSTTHVRVIVKDINDNAPVFTHTGPYFATIDENQPKGITVIQVVATDLDKGENGTVTYSFDSSSDQDARKFTIHSKTGLITTKEVMDHEEKNEYTLIVRAEDNGKVSQYTLATVNVGIADINEAAPVFETANVALEVNENTPPATTVGTVKATDPDSGENGRVSYYMVSGNLFGTFGVNLTTGAIYIARTVDYEMCSDYKMQIKAVDNSIINPKSSVTNVNITIIDLNDHAPLFEEDPVLLSIHENVPVGEAIYSFSAIDMDSGANSQVRYEIIGGSDNSSDYVRIDSTTGKLYTKHAIDYEAIKEISIIVKAADQPKNELDALETTVTALIKIDDINDNAPVFVSRSRIDVMEDEPLDYPLMYVIANDRDSLENGHVSYVVSSGNEEGHFSLESATGLFTIGKLLDREGKEIFRLNITACDHGHPRLCNSQILMIYVIDTNDNPPIFDIQSVYKANISENKPPNTFLVKVHATDKDVGQNAKLTYIIPMGIAENRFKIDPQMGVITTADGALDRETRDSYVVTAYVRDGAFPSLYDTTTILVDILDKNDNAPVFKDPYLELEVPENAEFSVIHTVRASDLDIGVNGQVVYAIIAGDPEDLFEINDQSGQLSCQPLNREAKAKYNLTISATDHGDPPMMSVSHIVINVRDENDNDPYFEDVNYSVQIPEDLAVNHSIIQVTASDRDEGLNARITYALDNNTQGLFKINNATGMITSAGEFDREKIAHYSFEALAIDGGLYGPRIDRVKVDVTILDVNDHKPVFKKIPYQAGISNTLGRDQFVVKVEADDKDIGENSTVRYMFDPDTTTSTYFKLDSQSGIITTSRSLDEAAVGVHRLDIVAADQGQIQLSSKGLVEITVGNTPDLGTIRFRNLMYNVSLFENVPRNTPVAHVTADFVGSGQGSLVYSFVSGNEENTFSIRENTGHIVVNNPAKLDYEIHQTLRLIIAATANNAYGYSTVWVNLKDVNDHAPRFTQDRYSSSVWEQQDKGTYVAQVSASDLDSGINSDVTYTIVSGNNLNGYPAFIIDPPHLGIVKTKLKLDREVVDSYRLEIEARDNGNPSMSSTCTLRIMVIDINDNPPYFPQYKPVKVQEGTELGTIIKTVTANDVDLKPTLTYDFSSAGNPDGTFSIDRFSGKISVAKELDYEIRQNYNLMIEVSDSEHVESTELMVLVQDINDSPPEFSQQSYQVTIPELTSKDYSLITVNATDRDSGENARITYSMLPQDGFFVNSLTGTIYTNKTIVYDATQPTVHLVVTARDHGTPSLSEVVAIKVQVIDINNHSPEFSRTKYSASVSEDALRGQTVENVLAIDQDDSIENKKVYYSIVGGNTANAFQISQTSGDIILIAELDRERTAMYELVVMAKDRGDPPLNSTVIVEIIVEDINDNQPTFDSSEYHIQVNETMEVDSKIIRMVATDLDTDANGRLRYEITSGNDQNLFIIDPRSGWIRIADVLDHEKTTEHRLIIKAQDSSQDQPKKYSLTTVIINVTDVNEHRPFFPVMMYQAEVRENEPTETSVFTANAIDNDGGFYGLVEYQLLGDNSKFFSIDRHTGEVKTSVIFDYEARNSYRFEVQATDRGGHWAIAPIKVDIESVDEYAPKFDTTEYSFSVPGNAKAGDVIGQVIATDQDGGESGVIVYTLKDPHEYFAINATHGILTVVKDLQSQDGLRRRRRFVSRQFEVPQERRKRSLQVDEVTMLVIASTGKIDSLDDFVAVKCIIDRECSGCGVPGPRIQPTTLSGTPLVLVIVFVIIAVILIIVIAVMYIRSRERKRQPTPLSNNHYVGSFDGIDIHAPHTPREEAPPSYNAIHQYSPRHNNHNITTSDISDQSHSASSGRGSASDQEDEEIRAINSDTVHQVGLRGGMPDSGIQQDEDAMSEHSVRNHKDYLARLGIDSSKINTDKPKLTQSVESMHQFSDEGGGEGDGLDIGNLVYAKLGEVAADENLAIMDGTREFNLAETEPSHAGSLSSVINSEEEFSGSYNWDYLLDWGPQYHPLAHVFAEIARLKDENIQPKKQPTKIVQQDGNWNSPITQVRTVPPPLITNAPPKTLGMQHIDPPHDLEGHMPNSGGQGSGSSSSSATNSNRTSLLTSLSSPRSPISHESSFTSPAFSPSFTPTLSPLATRSPSISPLQSEKNSGHSTPQKPRQYKNSILQLAGSSDGSEQEIRI
ncbi:unnamed protein product, partial [Owenia fusiformis]